MIHINTLENFKYFLHEAVLPEKLKKEKMHLLERMYI